MNKLSVALAVKDEENNLERCLKSIQKIAQEIVVVDGGSTDRTVDIARQYKAKIIQTDNPPIFHINKEKAVEACSGDWILQLDADEEVSLPLAGDIEKIIQMSDGELTDYSIDTKKYELFIRHQGIIDERDHRENPISGQVVAFYLPRKNFFLGHPLKYAGTYPDGVIRLFRKGKAYVPAKSVHEQIIVEGRVSWLTHDLLHYSNPTIGKYLKAAGKYTSLLAKEIPPAGLFQKIILGIKYVFLLPSLTFFRLFIRHKGILDGWYGFLFSFFSSLHYPVAYYKYVTSH